MKPLVPLLSVLLATLACSAAEFDLGARGTLSIKLPPFWSITKNETVKSNGVATGYALQLNAPAPKKGVANLSLMFTPPLKLDDAFVQDALVRGSAKVDSKKGDVHSIELFSLKRGYGAYTQMWDPRHTRMTKAAPDDFKCALLGVVQPDERIFGSVMLMVDDPNGAEAKAMIEMVNSVEVRPKEK
jgi:hypothetical protein